MFFYELLAEKRSCGVDGDHHGFPTKTQSLPHERFSAFSFLFCPVLLVKTCGQLYHGVPLKKVVANLGSAVVFGSIFWKLGMGQSHINDRIGLLQVELSFEL